MRNRMVSTVFGFDLVVESQPPKTDTASNSVTGSRHSGIVGTCMTIGKEPTACAFDRDSEVFESDVR